MQFLSRTLSPPTICNYLSGVKLLHLFSGLDFPFNKDFLLSLTLRGILRNALQTPCRAPPVTPDILCQISRVLDFETDPTSWTLFCAFLFLPGVLKTGFPEILSQVQHIAGNLSKLNLLKALILLV